jgi:hypothetical protein
MAAEFSRELGVKCYEGQRRLASMGFRVGGMAGYGLRRMLIPSANNKPRILQAHEYKYLAQDRIVLVPGPKSEVHVVQQIYGRFLASAGRMSPGRIACELNSRNIKFVHGHRWSDQTVREVLSNPKYAGFNAWGRTSQKMRSPQRRMPEERWVVKPQAFAPIISLTQFQRVQELLHRRKQRMPDQEVLNKLKPLLRRTGCLTREIIDKARNVPSSSCYARRFGSFQKVYDSVGYRYQRNMFLRNATARRTTKLQQQLVADIVSLFPLHVEAYRVSIENKRLMVRVDGRFPVAVITCRHYKTALNAGWILHPAPSERDCIALLALFDDTNDFLERFLMVARVGIPGGQYKFNDTDPLFQAAKPLSTLRDLYAVATHLHAMQEAQRERTACGLGVNMPVLRRHYGQDLRRIRNQRL